MNDILDILKSQSEWKEVRESTGDWRLPRFSQICITRDPVMLINTIPETLAEKVLSQFKARLADFREDWTFLGIQKYEIGDYIPPHDDHWCWHKLLILTTSENELDGITIETSEEEGFIWHSDIQGKMLTIQPGKQHWVNPVRDGVRYTAVIAVH